MERRRWCRRTAWGGGIASGLGVVLFALFSDAGGACTANVIVLSNGVIGPHGCAASSIAYHAGIGLLVIGATLLVGACVLAVIGRTGEGLAVSAGTTSEAERAIASAGPQVGESGATAPVPEVPNVEKDSVREREQVVALPPGWYGNPSNRNGAVQWWDGRRLVDRPPRGAR